MCFFVWIIYSTAPSLRCIYQSQLVEVGYCAITPLSVSRINETDLEGDLADTELSMSMQFNPWQVLEVHGGCCQPAVWSLDLQTCTIAFWQVLAVSLKLVSDHAWSKHETHLWCLSWLVYIGSLWIYLIDFQSFSSYPNISNLVTLYLSRAMSLAVHRSIKGV